MAQQLQQQMQQLNAASMWGNLTGLNSLGPQYLAVSTIKHCTCSLVLKPGLYSGLHVFVNTGAWAAGLVTAIILE